MLSPELLDHVFDALPIGVAVCDAQGVFMDVNPAYAAIYGNTPEDMIGRDFTMIFPEHLRPAQMAAFLKRFESGISNLSEYVVVDRHGSPRNVLADGYPIIDANGEKRRVIFIVDITDRVRGEQEKLIQARQSVLIEKLEQAVKATKPPLISSPLRSLLSLLLPSAGV